MKSLLTSLFKVLSSMRLTMICLSAAMILIFAGTLAQVQLGIQIVQESYFQSIFVWWPMSPDAGFRIPVFPGGHLIGGILLVNLILAHIRHFAWNWSNLGIQLTHAGLIIMLAGGLMTDLFSVESQMRLDEGQTKNYSVEIGAMELAVTDVSDPEADQVTSIPGDTLEDGRLIVHESLPFRILVKETHPNSRVARANPADQNSRPAASQGVGSRYALIGKPQTSKPGERNMMSSVIEIIPGPQDGSPAKTSLGTWMVSDGLATVQSFEADGKTWQIALRPRRHYKPFSLTLHDFVHERYPGTQIPKNFSSRVTLTDPTESVSREVLIYMNHPLRYGGETYYQSGFDRNEETTILQVVRNPSVAAPYVSCVIVSVGLLLQFSMHLIGFSRRNKLTPSS
jgi:hypothetical protein